MTAFSSYFYQPGGLGIDRTGEIDLLHLYVIHLCPYRKLREFVSIDVLVI